MSGSVREGLDLWIIESGREEMRIEEDGLKMESFQVLQ